MDQKKFDAKADEVLVRLTTVSTVEDLLSTIREAAAWALENHRAEVKERADREAMRQREYPPSHGLSR